MESLRGELASLYKKQFMKLDSAECAGKDVTMMRIQLLEAYVKDLNEQNEMLVSMAQEMTQLNEELNSRDKESSCRGECLQNVVTNLQRENDRLGEFNVSLECQKEDLMMDVGRLKKMNNETARELGMLNDNLNEQEEFIQEYKREINRLKCCLDKANKEVDELCQRLTESTEQLGKSHTELNAIENDMHNLTRQSIDIQSSEELASRMVKELTDELSSLEADYHQEQQKTKSLQSKLNERSDEVSSLQNELGHLQGEVCHLRGELRERSVDVKCLREELGERSVEVNCLRGELKDANQKTAALTKTTECLQGELQNADTKNRELESCLRESQATIEDNQSQLGDTTADLKDHVMKLLRSQSELDSVQHALNVTTKSNADLSSDIAVTCAELEEVKEEMRCLSQENEENLRCIQDMQSPLDQLKGAEEEVACLQRELSESESKMECMDQCMKEKDMELQDTMDILTSMKKENMQMMTDINEMGNENDRLKSTLVEQTNQLKADLAEACDMYNTLVKRNDILECELDTLRQCVEERETERKDLQSRLDELIEENGCQSIEFQKLEMEMKSLEKELDCFNHRSETAKKRSIDANIRAAKLETVVNDYKCEMVNQEEAFCRCNQEKEDLEEKLVSLRIYLEGELEKSIEQLEKEKKCRRHLEYEIARKDQLINSIRSRSCS